MHRRHIVDAVDQRGEVRGARRVFDDVHAARGAGELVHVAGQRVDDRILAAAGVNDAGHTELGTGRVHDVAGDVAVLGLLGAGGAGRGLAV